MEIVNAILNWIGKHQTLVFAILVTVVFLVAVAVVGLQSPQLATGGGSGH